MGAIFGCFGACVRRIPWWAWLLLIVVGALLGLLTYFGGLVTAGVFVIVAAALIKSMLLGVLGALGVTLLYCLLGCLPARSPAA